MRTLCSISSSIIVTAPAFAGGNSDSLLYGFTDLATNLAALALVVFLFIVWKFGGFKIALQALDKKASTIEAELEQARILRENATEALAKAQRRQEQVTLEAENILNTAKAQADAMMLAARKESDDNLARKEAQLEARITRAEADAITDIKNRTVDLATQASAILLQKSETDTQIVAVLNDIK